MTRTRIIVLAALALLLISAASAEAGRWRPPHPKAPARAANAQNSIQPAHAYFGEVKLGDHPVKLLTWHNGTGKARKIHRIDLSGSGGNIFATSGDETTCRHARIIPKGGSCVIQVHVKTDHIPLGWARSSLSLRFGFHAHLYASAEIRAHVVA